jgi:hypothetical protein
MRTMTAQPQPPAAFIDRELVQQLSRVAALADRAVSGPPAMRANKIDYRQRQRAIEREARRELRALRDTLDGMPLE